MRTFACALLFLCVVCVPMTASAQDIQLTVSLPVSGCVWTGPMTLTQIGCTTSFTGSAALTRVAGVAPACPATLGGTVSGTLVGSTLTFGLVTTTFGTINFIGTVSAGGAVATGTWSGPPGTGTWFAAVDVDVGGVTADMLVIRPADGCQWRGRFTAFGGLTGTGSMALTRVPGVSLTCAPTLSGPLSGTLIGPQLCFDFASLELGNMAFAGTVDFAAGTAMGTWSGPTAGTGTWFAQLPRPVRSAPTLSAIALATLGGLLLVAGAACVRRRTVRTVAGN